MLSLTRQLVQFIPTTEQTMAVSAAFSAIASLGLLVVAIWAWRTSHETLKATEAAARAAQLANEQAQRDSIEQTRPYVYAEIVPSLAGAGNYDLRIQNPGRSAARNLTFTFDPPLEQLDDVAQSVQTLLETPRTLPPGSSIRSYWRLEGNFTDGTKEAGLPQRGSLTAHYTSDDSSSPQYQDTYDFDLSKAGLWPLPAQGPVPEHLPRTSRLFYKLGRAIAFHIAELRR